MNSIKYLVLLVLSNIVISFVFAENVKNVIVRGNDRIDKATVIEYSGIHLGDKVNFNLQKNDILKRLYASDFFEKIKLSFNNGVVVIDVEEFKLVSNVSFVGNSYIKTNVLEKEILTEKGQPLSKFKIQSDINKIKEIYKKSGRLVIKVNVQIEALKNKCVKVIFNLKEGPKTVIRNIYFIGNKHYKDNELRSIILTKKTSFFRFLDNADIYDPDRLEYDKELLRLFYNSLGYFDFQVISATAQLSPSKDYIDIFFSLDEGKKFYIGKIDVLSNLGEIDISDVKRLISIKSGEIYRAPLIEKIGEKIIKYLTDKGYSQVSVDSKLEKNSKDALDVSFIIEKAEKIIVNKIEIIGNVKTLDKVIRRELRIEEGDLFNRSAVEQWENNLRNLDFFEKVKAQVRMTDSNDKVNLKVDVEEKSTSSIQLSGGYSSGPGPFVALSFVDKNFLGTGKHLDTTLHKSRKNISYSLSINNPYLFDRELFGGISIFNVKSDRDSDQAYDIKDYGVKFRTGYNISDNVTHNIFYTVKKDRLTTDKSVTSYFIQEQLGKFLTSAIGHSLTYENLDNRVSPKRGFVVSGIQEYAGVGGQICYLKHELEGIIFKSFLNDLFTLKISVDAGHIRGVKGKKVKINNRFSLGDYSFRGFEAGGIGARDINTKEGLGGQKFYTVSGDLLFPLGLPKEVNISGNIFFDFGSLWSFDRLNEKINNEVIYDTKKPRMSVGFGFLWVTQAFPVKIDFAWPVIKQKYDKKQHFHFKISTSF